MRTSALSCAALGAFVLVTSFACNKDDPNSTAYWLGKAKDPKERSEALRQVGRLGKTSDASVVKKVLGYLQEEGEWQPDAAYALGELGDKGVSQDLVKQLDFNANPNDRVGRVKTSTNQAIARALARLRASDGVDPLVRLAGRADDRTRETAIRALGDLGDKTATDALLGFLSPETPAPLARTAVSALGALRDGKAAPRLVVMLYEERGDVTFYDEARFALIQIGEPAVAILTQTIERKNDQVEKVKLASGKPLPEGAVEARAGSVLGAMRAKAAEPVLIATLAKLYAKYKTAKDDNMAGAVVELAYALGYLGTPEAAKALHPLAEDTDLAIRVAACEALTASGDTSALPVLVKATQTGGDDARRAAIVAVTRLGDASHLATFATLAKDEQLAASVQDDKVRLEAAAQCNSDPTCWRGKLGDANPRVRERAAYQLGWAGDKSAKDVLTKSAEDSVPEVRFASVLSLERLGAVDAKSLRAIQERSGDRMEYRAVNAEIARVLAANRDAN